MKRSLRSFDVLCLGLNAIVGSGIFLLPDDLYRAMGPYSPLAFVLCALGLLPVAACYAVSAKNHDQSGGPYLYARQAFGVVPAFGVGFMAFATGVLSFAAVAAAAAASLGRLLPELSGPLGLRGGAALGIVLFSWLNYRGARPGALTIDLFTIAKFAVLGLLLFVLLPELGAAQPAAPWPSGSGVGAAVFMAVFAAQGFEVVGVPAGESANPERDVPWAVLSSLLAASVLYAVVQLVLVGSWGAALARPSDTPLSDAATAHHAWLGFWVAIGGLISTWGFVAGTALGTPRYLFALSRGGHLPAALGVIHPRYHTPSRSILLTGSLALLLVNVFDYRALIGMSNVTIAVQYLTTCLAVAKMQRGPDGSRYALPGGPFLPVCGAIMSAWIFSEASLEELGWVAVTLAIGGCLLWLSRRQGQVVA